MKYGRILKKNTGGYMNKFRSFFAIIAAVAAISMASAAAPAAVKPDKTIEQKVAHEINMLPYYGVFDHIAFQVSGNTVILNGAVNSLGTRRDAENRVKSISGVANVVNNIRELPPSSFDNAIRRQTLRTFIARGPSQYFWEPNPDVRIIVNNGNVTLEGYVYNSSDSNTLNILANGVSNVFHVQNNLIVGKLAAR
jgi:hyperosmotically inducible protein